MQICILRKTMDNSKYLKTVIIDKLIENEANMVEDVTIEEARLNLYLNGEFVLSNAASSAQVKSNVKIRID